MSVLFDLFACFHLLYLILTYFIFFNLLLQSFFYLFIFIFWRFNLYFPNFCFRNYFFNFFNFLINLNFCNFCQLHNYCLFWFFLVQYTHLFFFFWGFYFVIKFFQNSISSYCKVLFVINNFLIIYIIKSIVIVEIFCIYFIILILQRKT